MWQSHFTIPAWDKLAQWAKQPYVKQSQTSATPIAVFVKINEKVKQILKVGVHWILRFARHFARSTVYFVNTERRRDPSGDPHYHRGESSFLAACQGELTPPSLDHNTPLADQFLADPYMCADITLLLPVKDIIRLCEVNITSTLTETVNTDTLTEKVNTDTMTEPVNIDKMTEAVNTDTLTEKVNTDTKRVPVNTDTLTEAVNTDNMSEAVNTLTKAVNTDTLIE
ncbi:hypothetical protein RRG08_039649 [Elysia crispata]|uniref:Uncharacterized protein n=1 Tax=Elysia crispata TaxID=231223 RepID=A0AAE0Y9W0_9GAST|nr:hypothetical protein RRG08_039649 [Elysia crispata]